MNSQPLPRGEMDRHLRAMRLTTIAILSTAVAAAVVMLTVPTREGPAPPMTVSLTAAAAALWVGFTANRDAQTRIDRIKRAFAATGDERRLLRDHRMVNLAVLCRLEVMVLAAVVADLWGGNPAVAWGVLALAAIMMGLSWPTADKTSALLDRAREQRGR